VDDEEERRPNIASTFAPHGRGKGWTVCCGCRYGVLPLVPEERAVPSAMPVVGSERDIQSIFYHLQKIYSAQAVIKLYLSSMGPMRRCG